VAAGRLGLRPKFRHDRRECDLGELHGLLQHEDGFVWLDIPFWGGRTRISQSQLDFLMGVTEFYRARTDTKMTIAAERLAVIAAVTLPVTALSSILGMNVIVNERTLWLPLVILLVLMLSLSLILLR